MADFTQGQLTDDTVIGDVTDRKLRGFNWLDDRAGADAMGLVTATPAANTLLGRLKGVQDALAALDAGDASAANQAAIIAALGTIAAALAGTLAVDPVSHVAATDRGGTITAGGTAQQLIPANPGRRGIAVQNQSSGDLYINGSATAAANQTSLKIKADEFYETGTHSGTGAISIFGATTGQAFYAREW